MTKAKKIALTVAVIIIALIVLIGNECYYTVNEDEYANTLRFSKTVKEKRRRSSRAEDLRDGKKLCGENVEKCCR